MVPDMLLVLKSEKPPKRISDFGPYPSISRQSVGLMNFAEFYAPEELCLGRCISCGKFILSVGNKLVWPERCGIPAHPEMPEDVKEVFEEAQSIHSRSPRAACAMLRCAAERLVDHLNPGGKGRLADRLAALDISKRCMKILTVARLTGNEAVHGKEIDFSETNAEALARCTLISKGLNQVVDEVIAQEKDLADMETELREAQRKRR